MGVKQVKAVINGVTTILTLNSSTGKYEATITAPAKSSYKQTGHYYPVSVTAEDLAGNTTTVNDKHSTLGSNLRLTVKEKVAPIIAITSPTSGELTANNKPTITFNVTDEDSGVAASTVKLYIDDKEVTGLTNSAITNGYTFTYTVATALVDGAHTVKVTASDNDGNAAGAKTLTFNVLATAPNLAITSPAEGAYFKAKTVSFAGTTNGAKLTVKVGNGTAQNVTITDGKFSGTFDLAAEGKNVVTFVSTSASGVTTTVTRNLYLDTVAPIISAVTITPNPVDAGKTYIISVSVTD